MNDIRIRDLYAGRPDAKDEISTDGIDNFIKSFVVSDHFNLDRLTDGKHCFITGFKGTGKTALLFYLEEKLKKADPHTCSSFIFFKDEYTDVKKSEMQNVSNRVQSSVCVEHGALTNATEFEYVWRWILLKQIISDNEEYNRNLFLDDEHWSIFEKTVGQIKDPRNNRKITLPNKIKMALSCKDMSSLTEYTPEVEVDFQNQASQQYHDFVELVDKAEVLLGKLTRTDIPYYIFIDELEAYYGEQNVFFRDLYMIRDLVFTVKRFNLIFNQSGMPKTKIICSIRSEIIASIQRFIVAKEINKVTSGYSVPLIWNYTNSNSYAHPIIQILLKRIAICSGIENTNYKEIYNKWFPDRINNMEAANYILNNSWLKPRDMVRLITKAQESLHNDTNTFSQKVFDSIKKSYSIDSLQEIKEELRALYTAEEIDTIISCFTGYRTNFSVDDLRTRINKTFPNTILETNFVRVIDDLYRLGFLGNYLPGTNIYHWQHKEDSSVILSDEWHLCVHYALHSALSIGRTNDRAIKRNLRCGDKAHVKVYKVIPSHALVGFSLFGQFYKGSIHISEFCSHGYGNVDDLLDIIHCGDIFEAEVIDYDHRHWKWMLRLISEDTSLET